MKRALWAVPILLLIGSAWLARGSYSYYYSQTLYPENWDNWIVNLGWEGNVTSSCINGYCGVTGDMATLLYQAPSVVRRKS